MSGNHRLLPLKKYIPLGSFEKILGYFNRYPIQLKITKPRKTRLGTYTKRPNGLHVITINNNLNKYSFLVTLLHELAHLIVREKYKYPVLSHGEEWKFEFREILKDFLSSNIFPEDIEKAIIQSLFHIKATQCSDVGLFKALSKYNEKDSGKVLMLEIPIGGYFQIDNGKILQHIKFFRTRSKCIEVPKRDIEYYSVPHTLMVKPVSIKK